MCGAVFDLQLMKIVKEFKVLCCSGCCFSCNMMDSVVVCCHRVFSITKGDVHDLGSGRHVKVNSRPPVQPGQSQEGSGKLR